MRMRRRRGSSLEEFGLEGVGDGFWRIGAERFKGRKCACLLRVRRAWSSQLGYVSRHSTVQTHFSSR